MQTQDATYAVGGISEVASRDGALSLVEKYNSCNDSWDVVKTDPSIPINRDHYGTAVHAGKLLVVGGHGAKISVSGKRGYFPRSEEDLPIHDPSANVGSPHKPLCSGVRALYVRYWWSTNP